MANRDQLYHAIRAASRIIEQPGVLIIGSQSILATWAEYELPDIATQSMELDVMPLSDDDMRSVATRIEGAAGEWSDFHFTHGFYLDGVDRNTATLPIDFMDRLVSVMSERTDGYIGYCLDPHDLAVAKLIANRQKDREFVAAIIEAELVDPNLIEEYLWRTHAPSHVIESAVDFLEEKLFRWRTFGISAKTPWSSLANDTATSFSDVLKDAKQLESILMTDEMPGSEDIQGN